jgi:hypothetical protein
MLYYFPQLTSEELHELFVCETKRFMEGLDSGLPHNELWLIRMTIKQILEELNRRKPIDCDKDQR